MIGSGSVRSGESTHLRIPQEECDLPLAERATREQFIGLLREKHFQVCVRRGNPDLDHAAVEGDSDTCSRHDLRLTDGEVRLRPIAPRTADRVRGATVSISG